MMPSPAGARSITPHTVIDPLLPWSFAYRHCDSFRAVAPARGYAILSGAALGVMNCVISVAALGSGRAAE
jgi:hypothetical protein